MAKSGRRRGASASAFAFAFFHVTSAHASFFSHARMEKKETARDKKEGKEGKERDPASHRAGILFIIASSNPFSLPP